MFDVIIGEGHYGNTWVNIFRDEYGNGRISHNNHSYYVHDAWLEIKVCVLKNSMEGQWITQALADNVQPCVMDSYLMQAVMRHASTDLVNRALEQECKRWYRKGVQDTQRELKKALGLKEGSNYDY